MTGRLRPIILGTMLISAFLALFHGCSTIASVFVAPEVELAIPMGILQRHSQKLGYSIEGKNMRLTEFYLHETEEVIAEVEETIIEDDGWPISETMTTIMNPIIDEFSRTLAGGDWEKIEEQYVTLIEGCNRCHTATEHEFIELVPARGTPPFNQNFGVKREE